MCMICFLSKKRQAFLRKSAQLSTDRFENTLEFYKLSYITTFNFEKNADLCSDHNIFEKDYKVVKKIEDDEIKLVFDTFKNAYLDWIDNNTSDAVNTISKFLNEKELLTEKKISDRLMFRARKSDVVLSHCR